jgi:antitoxin ParD1/3/4
MRCMAKNTSIALGTKLEKFVAEQVASGAYGSVSEVVRAGVRLLEERETQIAALRQALIDGESSGSAGAWDLQEFLAERRKAQRKAA